MPEGLPWRSIAHRAGWGGVDQALSSGINFAVTFVAVRSVQDVSFGAFSLVMVVYILLVGSVRTIITQPVVIEARGDLTGVQRAAGPALGWAIAVGAGTGTVSALAATIAPSELAELLVVLAASLPLLLLQDAGRSLLFGLHRPRSAAMNDLVWCGVTAALIIATSATTDLTAVLILLCWASGGGLAALLVLSQLRARPRMAKVRLRAAERTLRTNLWAAYLLTVGPSYLLFACAPLLVGLTGLGLLRAAYLPFSLFGLVLQSVSLVLLPVLAGAEPARLRYMVRWTGAALGAGAGLWWLLLTALPDSIGSLLLGDLWGRTENLRTLFGLALTCQAIATAALLALTVVDSSRLLRLRLYTGLASIAGGTLGALAWGPMGIALAIAGADAMAAAGGLAAMRQRSRHHQRR